MAGYGDDTKYAAWLTLNGYTLPSGLTAPVQRQRGSAYVDARIVALGVSGYPTGGYLQERAFPRTGATAYGADLPSDAIPVAIETASYFAAYQEGLEPNSLSVAVTASAAIKREKVGPIETEYRDSGSGALFDAIPLLSAVEALLAPFVAAAEPAIFVV